MAERTLRGDELIEAEKLARTISNALDDALIINGLIPANECLPFDMLSPDARQAIRQAAETVYKRLVFDPNHNRIAVVEIAGKLGG